MLNVITMVNKEVVKKVSFDERSDDDAMKKALVECDRAIWDNSKSDTSFLVALMQDKKVLRYMNGTDWYTPRTSIYE